MLSSVLMLFHLNNFLLQGKDGQEGAFGPQGEKGDKVRYRNPVRYQCTVSVIVMFHLVSLDTGS